MIGQSSFGNGHRQTGYFEWIYQGAVTRHWFIGEGGPDLSSQVLGRCLCQASIQKQYLCTLYINEQITKDGIGYLDINIWPVISRAITCSLLKLAHHI